MLIPAIIRRVLPVLLLAMACVASGCQGSQPAAIAARAAMPSRPARINHMVFIKLKSPAEAQELIDDCDTLLRPIPGMASYWAGRRLESGRANVDANFDVGFYAGFETIEAYDGYVNHPNHQQALAKWKPRWESVRIMDVVDESP